jgi:hypothetical protein
MLGIFGRGSSRKEASFSASHLKQLAAILAMKGLSTHYDFSWTTALAASELQDQQN